MTRERPPSLDREREAESARMRATAGGAPAVCVARSRARLDDAAGDRRNDSSLRVVGRLLETKKGGGAGVFARRGGRARALIYASRTAK